jgi:hypothetical protein
MDLVKPGAACLSNTQSPMSFETQGKVRPTKTDVIALGVRMAVAVLVHIPFFGQDNESTTTSVEKQNDPTNWSTSSSCTLMRNAVTGAICMQVLR